MNTNEAVLWIVILALAFALYLALKAMAVLSELQATVDKALYAEVEIYALPNGKGGLALEAIAAIEHDRDGINTWVHLKGETTICLTWAQGVELEQAWREWSRG